jgi:hypothetical protein
VLNYQQKCKFSSFGCLSTLASLQCFIDSILTKFKQPGHHVSDGILASTFATKFYFLGSFVAAPTFDPHWQIPHWHGHGIPQVGLYLGEDSTSG